MANYPTRSEGGSNSFAYHRENKPSGSEAAQSASSSRGQQYNPGNDPHYVTVPRRGQHWGNVMNDPTVTTGTNPSYGGPHAPPHGGDAGRYSFGNRPSAPHASQTHSSEADRAHPAAHLSYGQQILYQAPGYGRNEPYNAVGYIRRDGRVHDRAEAYEEYRPYEQADRLDKSRSDGWTNVQSNLPYSTE